MTNDPRESDEPMPMSPDEMVNFEEEVVQNDDAEETDESAPPLLPPED